MQDRSRRATNPDNYNAGGTVKKGPKLWRKSKNYLELQTELSDALRRAAAHRRFIMQIEAGFSAEDMRIYEGQ